MFPKEISTALKREELVLWLGANFRFPPDEQEFFVATLPMLCIPVVVIEYPLEALEAGYASRSVYVNVLAEEGQPTSLEDRTTLLPVTLGAGSSWAAWQRKPKHAWRQKVLQTLMRGRVLVMMGFDLADPAFIRAWEKFYLPFAADAERVYLVVFNPKAEDVTAWEDRGVRVIQAHPLDLLDYLVGIWGRGAYGGQLEALPFDPFGGDSPKAGEGPEVPRTVPSNPGPTTTQTTTVDLRLDAAVPERVFLGRSFEVAVALKWPASAQLQIEDLPKVVTGDVQLTWRDGDNDVALKIEITAPDCTIDGPSHYGFRLRRDKDSPVFYFQLTPQKAGAVGVVVTVYQEELFLGSARVKTAAVQEEAGAPAGQVNMTLTSEPLSKENPPPNVRGDKAGESRFRSPTGPVKNRYALLVGVNKYVDPGLAPLNFCVSDVTAMGELLTTLGYTTVVLQDKAKEERLLPTRDNVEAELARLCQLVGQDDLLLVQFACHGQLVENKPVLLTREIRVPTLPQKALPVALVEDQMRASAARRLILILDACHTGVDLGRSTSDPAFIHNVNELAEGFAMLAASTSQQKAQEWAEKEHGVFTYYMLEGLSGKADTANKGFVTVDDVTDYVLGNLRKWIVASGGAIQEPTSRTEGVGDMIMAMLRKDATPAGRAGLGFNPFSDTGPITDPSRFFDREPLLDEIWQKLKAGKSVVVVGESQVGKTSLLEVIKAKGPAALNLPASAFGLLNGSQITNEDEFYAALCVALDVPTQRGEALATVLKDKQRVLLIDDIDLIGWADFNTETRNFLRSLTEGENAPLRLVITSQTPLKKLYPKDKKPSLTTTCHQSDLLNFDLNTVKAFIQQRLTGAGVTFSDDQIKLLYLKSRSGHPARLQKEAATLFAARAKG